MSDMTLHGQQSRDGSRSEWSVSSGVELRTNSVALHI
jgi:hypothetical protein